MWWSALIAGACGAFAAAVAALLVRDSKNRRTTYIFVLALVFVVLNSVARTYVLPEIRVWEARREASKFFAENRVFSLLASRHPEIRQQFTTLMVDVARRGASAEESSAAGMEWGRTVIGSYFEQYAANASGDSLVAFASIWVEMLERLSGREDEACYYWMFGGQGPPGFSLSDAFSPDEFARMLDAMADVVQSSIAAPQEPLDAQRAAVVVESFLGRLMVTHGEDFVTSLGVLDQANAPNVDRRAACGVAAKTYRAVLDSPEDERELLLRSLFGAGAS